MGFAKVRLLLVEEGEGRKNGDSRKCCREEASEIVDICVILAGIGLWEICSDVTSNDSELFPI